MKPSFKKGEEGRREAKPSIANEGTLRERDRGNVESPKYRADYPEAHTESAHKEAHTHGQRLWETLDLTLIIKEIQQIPIFIKVA